jgi:2-dehydropantoate 2-reductase
VGIVLTRYPALTEPLQKVEEPYVESSRTEPLMRPDSLDIGVVGAGAIGSTFGASLAAGGFHVRFIDNSQARVNAINTGNLRLVCDAAAGPARIIPASAVSTAPGKPEFDVLLFTVKGYATEHAATAVSSFLRDGGIVISVQNGLGIHEQLARHFDPSRIAVGSTTVSAVVGESGDTHVAVDTWLGRSQTVLGAGNKLAAESVQVLDRFAGALSASGLPAGISESVDKIIWTKLCYAVSIGTVCAVAETDIAGALGSSSGRHLVRAVFEEVASVAQAVGVPIDAEAAWNDALQFWSSIKNHMPSMAIDVRAGRPTEVDSFALGMARLGSGVGVPATYCRCLGEVIKMKEPLAERG